MKQQVGNENFKTKGLLPYLLLSFLLLFLVIILALTTGPFHISLIECFHAFTNTSKSISETQIRTVVFDIRLPRIILGALVGAALSVSGGVYQTVFRNQLADPYLLGTAAGAGLGATIIFTTTKLSFTFLPLFAFIGALLTVALTVTLSGRFFNDPATLVLSGVAIGSFMTAVQTFLQQKNRATLSPVYSWLLGSLTRANWEDLRWVFLYIAGSLLSLFLITRQLDALHLSDDEARTLGVNVKRIRLLAIVAASLATATAVAASGLIGFVGLVVPHIVRRVFKSSSNKFLPIMAAWGAALLILADFGSRALLSPAELPIGIITAFIGAPFFLFILQSKKMNS